MQLQSEYFNLEKSRKISDKKYLKDFSVPI